MRDLPVHNESFARVVRNVLDQNDCAALLAKVNKKGFTPALVNIGGGMQQLMPELRDGHRIIVDSPEITDWLLEVLRPYLPEKLPGGYRLVGLNERCRFLCYTPGQSFPAHFDGCYRRPTGHPQEGDRSFITIQLYLHDVPANHGGATTFFPGRSYSVGHQPEAGSVLLFSQDLEHEGSILREGLKYTLRTEAMYTNRTDEVTCPAVEQQKPQDVNGLSPTAQDPHTATGCTAAEAAVAPLPAGFQTPPRKVPKSGLSAIAQRPRSPTGYISAEAASSPLPAGFQTQPQKSDDSKPDAL